MKQGTLIYNPDTSRYDVRFGLTDYYGGLHCGTSMDVMVGRKWVHNRIEFKKSWYLVGIETTILDGLRVRI